MSAVTTRSSARIWLAVALGLCVNCGSDTKMPPMGPSGGSIATIFAVYPETVRLGPGDRGWLFAQAAAVPSDPKDVTASTRWESLNPSVATVQGNIITAILPGEVEVRGAFQTFVATTHVTVFSPASIREFTIPPRLDCWPAETFAWTAQAVLDTGAIVLPSSVAWRSLDEAVVAVAPVEVRNLTGTIETDASVTCRSAGTTRVEATYAGRTAVAQVTVRAPRDLIEVRGASITQFPTTVSDGVDVFYFLESEASARIEFVVRDSRNPTATLASAFLPITRGGGSAHLTATVPWQGSTAPLCEAVDMVLQSGTRLRALGQRCPE